MESLVTRRIPAFEMERAPTAPQSPIKKAFSCYASKDFNLVQAAKVLAVAALAIGSVAAIFTFAYPIIPIVGAIALGAYAVSLTIAAVGMAFKHHRDIEQQNLQAQKRFIESI